MSKTSTHMYSAANHVRYHNRHVPLHVAECCCMLHGPCNASCFLLPNQLVFNDLACIMKHGGAVQGPTCQTGCAWGWGI